MSVHAAAAAARGYHPAQVKGFQVVEMVGEPIRKRSDVGDQSAAVAAPHHTLLGRTHLTDFDVESFQRDYLRIIEKTQNQEHGFFYPDNYECILTCPVCAKKQVPGPKSNLVLSLHTVACQCSLSGSLDVSLNEIPRLFCSGCLASAASPASDDVKAIIYPRMMEELQMEAGDAGLSAFVLFLAWHNGGRNAALELHMENKRVMGLLFGDYENDVGLDWLGGGVLGAAGYARETFLCTEDGAKVREHERKYEQMTACAAKLYNDRPGDPFERPHKYFEEEAEALRSLILGTFDATMDGGSNCWPENHARLLASLKVLSSDRRPPHQHADMIQRVAEGSPLTVMVDRLVLISRTTYRSDADLSSRLTVEAEGLLSPAGDQASILMYLLQHMVFVSVIAKRLIRDKARCQDLLAALVTLMERREAASLMVPMDAFVKKIQWVVYGLLPAGVWKHTALSVRKRLVDVLHRTLTKDWGSARVVGEVQGVALICLAIATHVTWQWSEKVSTGPLLLFILQVLCFAMRPF
jgi:hypothetical protein